MNYETAVATMRAFFKTAWGSTTDIAWDDVDFTPPNGSTWVRCSVLHFDGFQASIGAPGNNRHRRTGSVIIQVFAPQGKASIDAREKADLAVAAFIGQTTQGIVFNPVFAKEIGNDGRGWYQINVYADFYYDHLA